MPTPDDALSVLPKGLRKALLVEYTDIVNNYLEHRWSSAELAGGRFCEVVYSILHGHATGSYPHTPSKPGNFVQACRQLENNAGGPRSFQILIPRMLPPLYEVRNNRNVGHVGGDVNPDAMDSSVVVSMSSWILAELIRVFHSTSTEEAQRLVDSLSERRVPLVWKGEDVRRVLKPDLNLRDHILLLLNSASGKALVDDVFGWTGYDKRGYFNRLLRQMHAKRLVEFNEKAGTIELLPPGSDVVESLIGGQS